MMEVLTIFARGFAAGWRKGWRRAWSVEPRQVGRLDACDLDQVVEACRPIISSLRPLLKYQLNDMPTEIRISVEADTVAVIDLPTLRRALTLLEVAT